MRHHWTESSRQILAEHANAAVAAMLGISLRAVTLARLRLGIPIAPQHKGRPGSGRSLPRIVLPDGRIVCVTCQQPFAPTGKGAAHQKTCSTECAAAYRRLRNQRLDQLPLTERRRATREKYAQTYRRQANRQHLADQSIALLAAAAKDLPQADRCFVCGEPVIGRHPNATTCSPVCAGKLKALKRRARESKRSHEMESFKCPRCGGRAFGALIEIWRDGVKINGHARTGDDVRTVGYECHSTADGSRTLSLTDDEAMGRVPRPRLRPCGWRGSASECMDGGAS